MKSASNIALFSCHISLFIFGSPESYWDGSRADPISFRRSYK